MQNLFQELSRRNVFRVGIAYGVIAWVVAQVAELALDSFEAPAWVMKTLLLLMSLGAPLVMIIAWAYELTPEGVKREKDVDRSQSITQKTAHKLDYIIIGTLVVAVGLLLADKFLLREPVQASLADRAQVQAPARAAEDVADPVAGQKASQQSIAVLPFVDMSPQKDQEYFSDGISEELLNVLVKIKGVKVASRTSSFAFKGKDIGIPEIARELNVDNVLEGSVRKAGDQVRITAQLIDVRTDRHLWSETYDRKLEDVFAVQDEIAQKIVEALTLTLGAGEKAALAQPHQATENLEAYELFLRGRALWQRRGAENIRKSIDLLDQATKLDPGFSRAWSALAAAHLTLPVYDLTANEAEEWRKADSFARKGLALDPDVAEALAVMGDLTRGKGAWQEAETYYHRAIALEPGSVTGPLWYAEFLMDVGRVQEALTQNIKAVELDPLSPGANINLSNSYYLLGNFQQAARYALVGADLGHTGGMYLAAQSYVAQGNYVKAREYFDLFVQALGLPAPNEFGNVLVEAAQDPGARPRALALGRELEVGEDNIVTLLVQSGDLDQAFSEIPLTRDNWANIFWYLWDVKMAPLRRDPRFKDIVREAGLVDYWRNNTWSDYCHPRGDDFYCE
jgi:TolB-like protein/Tfp pilus assembly protein PilF